MSKLRLTVVLEYDWTPSDYDTTNPETAARIDQEELREDPRWMLDRLMGGRLGQLKIDVEAVP